MMNNNSPINLTIKDIYPLLRSRQSLLACDCPYQEFPWFFDYIVEQASRLKTHCLSWNLAQGLKWVSRQGTQVVYESVEGYFQPSLSTSFTSQICGILQFLETCEISGIFVIENVACLLGSSADDASLGLREQAIALLLAVREGFLERSKRGIFQRLVLLGSDIELSERLRAMIPLLQMPFPTLDELVDFLKGLLLSMGVSCELSEGDRLRLAQACCGFTYSQVEECLSYLAAGQPLTLEILPALRQYKIARMQQIYGVEFVSDPEGQVAGLEQIQQYFADFAKLLEPEASRYNLKVPKGAILAGPPGTGKSYITRRLAQLMNCSLLLADWGALIGETPAKSEANLRRLLNLAGVLSPSILYFDDMDKGLAGWESNRDGGVARRMTGKLLTWMQDRVADVCVVASVNRLEYLPPELTRPGRFDWIFFVDLPNDGERQAVLRVHLQKFDRRFAQEPLPFGDRDWQTLVRATLKCSHAELAAIVSKAAMTAFCRGRPGEISVEDLLAARETTSPLALRDGDRVASMRRNAAKVGLAASSTDRSRWAIDTAEDFF